MAKVGRNLAQRREDESAFGQRGMWKGKPGRNHHEIAQDEQVQVEGTRTVGSAARAVATVSPLDGQQDIEERFGIDVPEAELEGVQTVGQAYELVASKL